MLPLKRTPLAQDRLNTAHTAGAPVRPVAILQIKDGNFLRGFIDMTMPRRPPPWPPPGQSTPTVPPGWSVRSCPAPSCGAMP
jgi:hypothetical protein